MLTKHMKNNFFLKALSWLFKTFAGSLILTIALLLVAIALFSGYNKMAGVPFNSIKTLNKAEIAKLNTGDYFKTDVKFIEPLGAITSSKKRLGVTTSKSENYFALLETADKTPIVVDLKSTDLKPEKELTPEQEEALESETANFDGYRTAAGDANKEYIGSKVFKKTSVSSKFIFKDKDLEFTYFSLSNKGAKVSEFTHANLVTEKSYESDKSSSLTGSIFFGILGAIMAFVTYKNFLKRNDVKVSTVKDAVVEVKSV
jgi:hypothetical protein